ncbi:MAG: hypothetical protein E6K69_01775 [Nitrospirae bacterium]|nr:MAG: hypothetical protein E6K69_01775 [Nitrospirota bacterium]
MRPKQLQWLGTQASVVVCAVMLSAPAVAQHLGTGHESAHQQDTSHETGVAGAIWEGSQAGKAFSEFNHHIAGIFVLLIGLSELREALAVALLAGTRFMLPIGLLGAGTYLIIWSDHEAWPIGSLSFVQTFFSGDWEILQHKVYAMLHLTVGTIELLKRMGRLGHAIWKVPLPTLAVIAGMMLFLHSHGAHPAAHKIALHHAVMGTMAIIAGSSKFASGWTMQRVSATKGSDLQHLPSRSWGVAWVGFILLIGIQLLLYSE